MTSNVSAGLLKSLPAEFLPTQCLHTEKRTLRNLGVYLSGHISRETVSSSISNVRFSSLSRLGVVSIILLLSDRMPVVIGSFISRNVYSSRLLTHHGIVTPTCCRFVDVRHGWEMKAGHSWTVCSLLEDIPLFTLKIYLPPRTQPKSIVPSMWPSDTSEREESSRSSRHTMLNETRLKMR